jgi:cathepsin D
MYFSTAFVAAAFPFLVAALPAHTPRPHGLSIPLSKRDVVRRIDGTIDLPALRASIRSSVACALSSIHLVNVLIAFYSKVHRGFAAYERNMGTAHPLAAYISVPPSTQKRQTGSGADALTDDSQVLWFGTIEVGTPPKQFTGVFSA